jgi:hypothetical protein
MKRVLVKPVEGRRVRIPNSNKVLTPEGAFVVLDSYWLRRVEAGDVTVQTDGQEVSE